MCELKEKSKREKCQCGNLNGHYVDKAICDILLNYDVDGNVFNNYLSDIRDNTQFSSYDQDIKRLEAEKIKKQG